MDFSALAFVSGLSFFTMGLAIAVQCRNSSTLRLAQSLALLAAFGLLYGFSEWGNLFVPLQVPQVPDAARWKLMALQRVLQGTSYFFLLLFGLKLVRDTREGPLWLLWLALVPLAIWWGNFWRFAWYVGSGTTLVAWFQALESPTRLWLGLPGALAAAYGFWLQRPEVESLHSRSISANLRVAVLALLMLAFFSGMVTAHAGLPWAGVSEATWRATTGIPVELLRTLAGFLLALAATRLLAIFDLENQQRLEESRRQQAILVERDRFSRDLHDGVLQAIYGVGLTLEMCTHLLKKNPEAVGNYLRYAMQKLNETVTSIRSYINGLQPPHLQAGLEVLIRQLVATFRSTWGVEVSLSYQEEARQEDLYLPADHVYYLVQEAMTNAVRHGQATTIRVNLAVEKDALRISIEDNGRGFIPGPREEGHYGLQFMRDRVEALSGHLEISSIPGQGTRVEALIPLSGRADQDIWASG